MDRLRRQASSGERGSKVPGTSTRSTGTAPLEIVEALSNPGP